MGSKQFTLKSYDGKTIVDTKISNIADRMAVRAFFSHLRNSEVIFPYEKEKGKLTATLNETDGASVAVGWLTSNRGTVCLKKPQFLDMNEGEFYLNPRNYTLRTDLKKIKGALYGVGIFGLIDGFVLKLKADKDYIVLVLISAFIGLAVNKIKDKFAFEGLKILENARSHQDQKE